MHDGDKQINGVVRVLVVNDDFNLHSMLHEVLQGEGYAVETASDGQQALTFLRQSMQPRVMLLDDLMPVMTGPEVLEVLAGDRVLAERTACVFLTLRPHPMPVELVRLLSQLNAPVVLYPFTFSRLLDSVEEAAARLHAR